MSIYIPSLKKDLQLQSNLNVRLPQSQRLPLRYLYFAASFTIWPERITKVKTICRRQRENKCSQYKQVKGTCIRNLVKGRENIVGKLDLCNCVCPCHWQPDCKTSNTLFKEVCHLRIDLVMHLFTERGVEHSVLSELLFQAHLEIKLMAGYKYTPFRDAHCAAKNSTKGNILSKDNSRWILGETFSVKMFSLTILLVNQEVHLKLAKSIKAWETFVRAMSRASVTDWRSVIFSVGPAHII